MRGMARPLVLPLFLLLVCGFSQAKEATSIVPPAGISCESLGSYSLERLNQVQSKEVKEFCDYPISYPSARYAVKLYRLTYTSVIPEENNRPTMASGLLAVPEMPQDKTRKFPVISYQHGTVFSKTAVPSRPDESAETRLNLLQFAGQGYIVIAADYFGKGSSSEPDSYLTKASTQQSCLDMLKAAQKISVTLHLPWGPLFLSGWSQGGWATMVFLNRLESENIPVTAAAPICAPEDLYAIINHWIHAPSENDSLFIPELLALQLHAYEDYYGLTGLSDAAIKPEYRAAARDLYEDKLAWPGLLQKFPRHLSEMLQSDFVAESSLGKSRYWELLQQNQAYRWRSKTTLHCYYGEMDEVVPPAIAELPISYQKVMNGSETMGVEVMGSKASHRGTFLQALADEKKWFDSFLGK
jgi:pimeloyl-ACP methyl ester carboxylesterase